jgi:hypothetical protein
MTNLMGKLAVALALAVIAMPATAYAQFGGGVQRRGGGGGQAAAPIQRSAPAMRSFTPHAGGRTFTPHVGSRTFTTHTGSRTFTPHVGRSANFARQHRVTTFNRSVQRTQRLHGVKQPNTATRTLRSTTGVRAHALRRNGSAAITAQAARQGRFGSRFAGRTGNRFANVPTPILTFLITRSGPTVMTMASGTTPMTISSTACSGGNMVRRRTMSMRRRPARA